MPESVSQHQPVTWSHGPLSFKLETADTAVVERAKIIFQYWSNHNPAPYSEPIEISQQVKRTLSGYDFRPSQDEFPPTVYSDISKVMRAAETDAALAVLNHSQLFLTVHGALLARDQNAVLIVGPSQAGKSTTACALWAAGWQLLSDDVSLLDSDHGSASPLPRRVSLRHPSRALLGDAFWDRMLAAETCDETPEGYVFHPQEIEDCPRTGSVALRAIVFLNRLGAALPAPAELKRIPEVQALLSLAPYTNVVRHGGLGEAMARLGPLVNRVPCYDFGRSTLPAMVKSLGTCLIQEAAREQLVPHP